MHHYLKAAANDKRVNEEVLSKKSQIEEEMFLGLRKKSGVLVEKFEAKFNCSFDKLYGEQITELIKQKLLYDDRERIHMTDKGFELGNNVFEKFLLDDVNF